MKMVSSPREKHLLSPNEFVPSRSFEKEIRSSKVSSIDIEI